MQSSCVEERSTPLFCPERVCPRPAAGFYCYFDGKLSLSRFGERQLLFARSNRARWGGGRHIQLAVSTSGGDSRFSRFEQLTFANMVNLTSSQVQANNIYFFVPIALRRTLIGLFPAVLASQGESGIFCSTSADALRWSAPQLLLPAPSTDGVHVADWPIDMDLPTVAHHADGGGARSVHRLRVGIQHSVYLHGTWLTAACDRAYHRAGPPAVCEYSLTVDEESSTPVCAQLAAQLVEARGPRRDAAVLSEAQVGQQQAEDCERRLHSCKHIPGEKC